MYKKDSYIAVRAAEEPFYIARCLENIVEKAHHTKKFKIKWLEKQIATEQRGIIYSLSYDDKVVYDSIICSVVLEKKSRQKFILQTEELRKIHAASTEDLECEKDLSNIQDADNNVSNDKDKEDVLNNEIIQNNIHQDTDNEYGSSNTFGCDNVLNILNQDADNNVSKFQENDNISNNLKKSRQKFILQTEELRKIHAASTEDLECENDLRNIQDADNNVSNDKDMEDVLNNEIIQNNIHQDTDNEYGSSNTFGCDNVLNILNQDADNNVSKFQENDNISNNLNQDTGYNVSKFQENDAIANYQVDEIVTDNVNRSIKKISSNNDNDNDVSNNIQVHATDDSDVSQKSWSDFSPSESEYLPNSSSDVVHDYDDAIKTSNCRVEVSYTRRRKKTSQRVSESEDEPGIVVNSTKVTEEGKRMYDKKHNCYFCNKLVTKLTRHLENVHSKEMEVAKYLALDATDARRKEGFLCILRAGDYYHNCEVLATKTGELILSRRPNNNLQPFSHKKYGPCPKCLGFFLLSNLWHHVKLNCPKSKPAASEPSDTLNGVIMRRDLKGESLALLGNALNDYSSDYIKYIVTAIKNDEVGEVCKNDELIMKFGLLLFEKYTKHQYDYIRQSMRQLGRLLVAIETIKGSKQTLKESVLPQNYDVLIASVKHLCLSERKEIHRQDYGIPSLALKLGHSLRKCALVARGIALRMGDLKTNKLMEAFLDLMTMEWTARVSAAALRTLKYKKMNAPELLPLTEDLLEINRHLKTVIAEATQKPNFSCDSKSWSRLAAATLCRIILFNKRRSGEASRMMLSHYASRPNWKEQSTAEMQATLSPMERNLADRLTIVEVPGKSRALTKVPILLTIDTKAAIDKLIETRITCGISKNNLYVFARGSNSEGYLRGHDCLRMFCNEANLQKPRLVTSTKLRKYIATVVQLFDLKESEYDWLARHLGHDIRVHRQFYRLHESAVELTKVSRILLAVDQGEANKFSGKALEEINITELPAIDESEAESENGSDDFCEDEIAGTSNQVVTGTREENRKTNVNKRSNRQLPEAARCVKKTVTRIKPNKKVCKKRMWSWKEKEVVLKFFRINVKNGIVPQKADIEKCIEEHGEVLKLRTWRDVKYCVYNHIQSTKRNVSN